MDLLAGLPARQAQYAANHGGRFWQGRKLTAVIPADGATAPTVTSAKQTDCPSWAAASVAVPPAMRCAVQIDAYEAPGGHGYVVSAAVRCQGTVYVRSRNVGPETWRTHGW